MDIKPINYPIIEALCEFHFIPSQPWDMTIPGLFYDRVKDEFPIKNQQMGLGIGFRPQGKEVQQKIELAPRIRFSRTDESALVQIAPNLLVVNHLRPYPKWENFKPLILKNLELYKNVAKPKGYKRILLRYINRFEFPAEPINLKELFIFCPNLPKEFPSINRFNVRVEFSYREGKDTVLMTLSSATPDKPDVSWLIFDILYALKIPNEVAIDQESEWLENAHNEINTTFNASITQKCKFIFGKEA